MFGLLGVRRQAEICKGRREHVRRRIQHHDAAGLEPARNVRIENHAQREDRRIGHNARNPFGVVADAGHARHVRHSEAIAGIGALEFAHHLRIEIGEIRQLRAVEFAIEPCGQLLRQKRRSGRHDEIVARAARAQFGVERLVRIVGVVAHAYAGLALETLDRLRRHVVVPIVDIEHGLRLRRTARQAEKHRHCRQKTSCHRTHSGSPDLCKIRASSAPSLSIVGTRPT